MYWDNIHKTIERDLDKDSIKVGHRVAYALCLCRVHIIYYRLDIVGYCVNRDNKPFK